MLQLKNTINAILFRNIDNEKKQTKSILNYQNNWKKNVITII